jgi:hypothetical protein
LGEVPANELFSFHSGRSIVEKQSGVNRFFYFSKDFFCRVDLTL